jgi:hypothetical protein
VENPLNGGRKLLPTKQFIDGDSQSDEFIYLKRHMEEKIPTFNDEKLPPPVNGEKYFSIIRLNISY